MGVKDIFGNELRKGDKVAFHMHFLQNTANITVAEITEVHEGGLAVSIGGKGNQQGVTPAQVRLIIDVTLTGNPAMPVFPMVAKVVSPGSEALVNRLTDA